MPQVVGDAYAPSPCWTPGGVARQGKVDSVRHAMNEDFLDDPSMSREYKSWPALGDMDHAAHTIFVLAPACVT